MNRNMFQGKWQQFRGNIKASFGELTDNDLLQADGNADKMQGALQERYGYSSEQAQTEWDKLLQKYSATLEDLIADHNAPAPAVIIVESRATGATQHFRSAR